MSVQNAMRFIARLQTDEELRERLVSGDDIPGPDLCIGLGHEVGLSLYERRAADSTRP